MPPAVAQAPMVISVLEMRNFQDVNEFVSIVYATQVDGKRAAGDLAGAREAARKAGLWAMWSALAGPILIALWFFLFGGLAVLGSLAGAH